jgi:hypothetical protein
MLYYKIYDILRLCTHTHKHRNVPVIKHIYLFCTRPEVCLSVCYNNPDITNTRTDTNLSSFLTPSLWCIFSCYMEEEGLVSAFFLFKKQ